MVLELIVTILEIFTDPIKEYIITPLKNHISYPFTCDSKVERLHHEVQQLQNRTDRLQQSVEAATRDGEEIYPNVTEWLSSAKRDIGEAEKLVQGKEDAKKKCCFGFCPNVKTLYKLSKKAHRKAAAMDEQLKSENGLYPISSRTPPPPVIELPSGEGLPSRGVIMDRIVDALKDPNLNMVGVHGMGGIGKTTLAKEVLGQAVKQKLFDDVVLVAVSETPDLKRIQGDLADALGMQFHAEGVPGRGRELHQRLKDAKALIILDDVWEKLDLNAIGIPSGEASKGCKIFLTSRKKVVLCSEMCTKKEFPLGLLEEEEAWRLFEKIVNMGDDLEFLANNRDLAKEVANKCGGLPLLIQIVATDLRNHKHLYAWEDMLKQIEDLEGTEIEDKVHKVIESSYKNLKDEKAKLLFLLCPLFGNSNIRIHDLLLYCMGLGLFKRDSIEESRNLVLTLIDRLKSESLLLEGDKAGFVKIHDVVRDIAAAIASKEHCAFVGKGQIKSTDLEREDYRRISLPYCEIPKLPEVLQCPEAEVFLLFVHHARVVMPNSFFEGVPKLKVLHFIGLSSMSRSADSSDSDDSGLVCSFPALPSLFGSLTCLQTLILERCEFTNVSMVAELKQLEVLRIADSCVEELPREIEALTRLKLLDLTGCYKLRVIPSNLLSNMHFLEELYVFNKYDGWGTEGNASLVELKNLSCLKTLEIRVKDDKWFPEDWFFNGIKNYKIAIGYWDRFNWYMYSSGDTSKRIIRLGPKTSIGLMDRIKELLGEEVEVLKLCEVNGVENLLCDSFQRLLRLHIKECDLLGLKSLLPFSSEKCFPYLREMKVESSHNMEEIVGEGNEDEMMEFTQLTSLKLKSLPHLRAICGTSGMVSFPSLTSLTIYQCKSLKYVFTTSMVKSLKQLKKLDIWSCNSMEEILRVTGCEEVVAFPELKELGIGTCSSLKNFVWKDSDGRNNNESRDEYFFNELVTLPNLEIMRIGRIKNLEFLWKQQFADKDSFSELKSLEITQCRKLSVVFPSNEYRRFERLESLYVYLCNAVKEIYEYEWSKDINEAFSFENLKSVIVHSCPDLKYVLPASIACGLLHLQELEIENCGVEMIVAEAKTEGSEGTSIRTFEWYKLKSLRIYYCNKFISIGSIISKAKQDIATQDLVYYIQKVIPNVEILTLDPHSLKAMQSDDNGFSVESLRKLKEVTLVNFKEESIPILFSFLRRIYSLEKLAFEDCCLAEILSLLDGRSVGDQEQQYHLGLKHLDLRRVSNLKHIVKEDSKLNPISECFQTLSVEKCNDMMNIAPSSVSLKNLTTLDVYQCEKLTSLVTASTAKSMIHLIELKVEFCDMMEDIIVANGDGDCTEEHDNGVITFNKLKMLTLHALPTLNWFCSGNYNINFPLLERVSILGCNQMKIFCGGVVITPKLHRGGNVNAIIARQIQEDRSVDMPKEGEGSSKL